MSDKKDRKKDNCIPVDESWLPTNTKEDNPFKHLRAIPIGPLHTNTKEVNPFLSGNGNKQKLLPKPENKPEKPTD